MKFRCSLCFSHTDQIMTIDLNNAFMSSMKNKRKLIVDCDDQILSPTVLMQNAIETTHAIESGGKIGKNKKDKAYEFDSMDNYLISVLEPSKHNSSSKDMEARRGDSNSLNEPTIKTPKSSSKSLSSRNNDPQFDRHISRQITKLKQATKHKKKKSCRLLFESNNILEGIVRSQKIKNLRDNFIKKIRRTSTCHTPVSYDKMSNDANEGFLYMKGIQVKPLLENILNALSVIQIISLLVIYSVSFVFEDLLNGNYVIFQTLQQCSLAFYVMEIILNFISIKYSAGKKIEVIKDIIDYYISQNFWIDFISVVILLTDISTKQTAVTYFRMFIIFKLPQCLDKIQKLEVYLIRNVYNEQYWQMVKVFLVNFGFAHLITLFLAAMATFSPTNNWIIEKGIVDAPWIERYVWSYYWATNIMLTVGFGDIVPVNYKEAICVIFIETFSCIMMAYNINRVGSIITNIRLQDQNRSKKFKIFKKLCGQNTVSEDLTFKINNYIQQSSKLNKKFNFQEDKYFLKELPDNLRSTYLKQANKEVLNKLVFFKSLLERTLCNFSEQLETKISHPQETIRALDDDFNLIILKKGHIGYACKKNGFCLNDSIVDEIKVGNDDQPFLTSLDFISKIRPKYEIKSLQFSVLFKMDYTTFIEIFRKSDMDYELFCFLRDKCRNIPDEFEVMPCEFCKDFNHFKFTCPKLHYVPYEQHVINKYTYKQKIGRNQRREVARNKFEIFKPMEYYKKVKGYREDLVKGSFRSKGLRASQLLKGTNNSKPSIAEKTEVQRPRSIEQIERIIDEKAREVIEIELLKKQNQQKFYDEVWTINLDVMANYNSYFSQDNPKYIEQKFSKEARAARINKQFNIPRREIKCHQMDIDTIVEDYKRKSFTGSFGEFYQSVLQ